MHIENQQKEQMKTKDCSITKRTISDFIGMVEHLETEGLGWN